MEELSLVSGSPLRIINVSTFDATMQRLKDVSVDDLLTNLRTKHMRQTGDVDVGAAHLNAVVRFHQVKDILSSMLELAWVQTGQVHDTTTDFTNQSESMRFKTTSGYYSFTDMWFMSQYFDSGAWHNTGLFIDSNGYQNCFDFLAALLKTCCMISRPEYIVGTGQWKWNLYGMGRPVALADAPVPMESIYHPLSPIVLKNIRVEDYSQTLHYFFLNGAGTATGPTADKNTSWDLDRTLGFEIKTTYNDYWVPNQISVTTIDDCEDNWIEEANVDTFQDNGTYVQGSASVRVEVAAGATAGSILCYENLSPAVDLSAYDGFNLWIKSSVNLADGDLQLLFYGDADKITLLDTLDIGEVGGGTILANTWTLVSRPFTIPMSGGMNDVRSIAIVMAVDKGAFTFYVDDIVAYTVADPATKVQYYQTSDWSGDISSMYEAAASYLDRRFGLPPNSLRGYDRTIDGIAVTVSGTASHTNLRLGAASMLINDGLTTGTYAVSEIEKDVVDNSTKLVLHEVT
jgi:hypothetical protein